MTMSIFEDKTILITGATGLVGTHLVKRLLTCKGCTVIALGRNIHKLESVFHGYAGSGELILMEGDVAEGIPCHDMTIDYIFHAASPIDSETIRNKPLTVIRANVTGTLNCLEFLKTQKEEKKREGKMIVLTSSTVYGNITSMDKCVVENDTQITDYIESPNAPYSESKRMVEVIARAYSKQHGLSVYIARLSYVYGYSKEAPNTAFYEFVNKSLSGEDIVLNRSDAPKRDNIYVDDATEGILCMVEKGIPGEAYNISSGGDKGNYAAIDEIAQEIATASNRLKKQNINIVFKEEHRCRKPGLMLDNNKVKGLGWSVRYSLTEGIEKTLESYIKAGKC